MNKVEVLLLLVVVVVVVVVFLLFVMLEEEPVKPTLIRKHFSRAQAFASFRGEGTPLFSKANSRINILSFLRPRW